MKQGERSTIIRFILTGLVNTFISVMLIALFLHVMDWNYWVSTFTGNFVSFLFAFFLGKIYTFQNRGSWIHAFLKFSLNFFSVYLWSYFAGYFIGYMFARLGWWESALQESVSAFIGLCLFPVGNYIGQRYFVFKEEKKEL